MPFRLAAQRILIASAILGLLSLVTMPPEHVHVAETHDGGHSNLVHRHASSHLAHGLGTGHTARLTDEDDDPAEWLGTAFTASAKVTGSVRLVLLPLIQTQAAVTPLLARHRLEAFATLSVHSPPLTTSSGLRAPPAFS